MMNDFNVLLDCCRGKHVFIQTHNFPDPDAIGSAFGLQKLLEQYEITSTLCYAGIIDKLSTSKMISALGIEIFSYEELSMTESDCIICVDSQKNSGNITDFIGDEIACIDHHPTFVEVEYLYKDVQIVGACSTIIAEYFKVLGRTPDPDTATALLYGIKMDTLQFTRGVTQLDIDAFAFLNPICDGEKLAKLCHNNMEFSDLRAYGAAISNIKVYDKVGIAGIPFSCPDALIGILSDFILALQEVEVAILYSIRDDGIKFSVRSEREEVHAGKLIHGVLENYGNGGGHAAMAGGLIPQENVHLLGKKTEYSILKMFTSALGINTNTKK